MIDNVLQQIIDNKDKKLFIKTQDGAEKVVSVQIFQDKILLVPETTLINSQINAINLLFRAISDSCDYSDCINCIAKFNCNKSEEKDDII